MRRWRWRLVRRGARASTLLPPRSSSANFQAISRGAAAKAAQKASLKRLRDNADNPAPSESPHRRRCWRVGKPESSPRSCAWSRPGLTYEVVVVVATFCIIYHV